MKSYLSLIPISARVRKKQNKLTIICIILAVFLVTSIFSMADMELRSQKIRAISDYGNWHINIKDISYSDANVIKTRSDVAFSSWYGALNYRLKDDYYIGSKRAAICGVEKQLLTNIMEGSIADGIYPQNDNSIMLTENAKTVLNIDIGDSIALKIPSGENIDFTVSGFVTDTAMVSRVDAIVAFMNIDMFDKFYSQAKGIELSDSDMVYYVQFKNYGNIKKSIQNVKEQCNLSDKQIGENAMLLGIMGFSNDSYMLGLYLMAGVLFLLVLMAGVLMISSSINSNVSERMKFFGMMRCIGAGKVQIMRFVRLEALNWCKTAIPIGVLTGVILTWILCAILRLLSSQYFSNMPVFGVSCVGIGAGVIVGILTVLFAAQLPAKRAAKVSPLAAVSGNAYEVKSVQNSAKVRFVKVDTSLGINHAMRSKKNLILMVSSFSLSIILFLSFSVLITFMNHAITPLQPYSPDLSIVCEDSSCSIEPSLASKISGMNGVKRVYGRRFAYDVPAKFGNVDKTITLISYESNQFNWIDEEGWSKNNLGLEKVSKDINEGYVLYVYGTDIMVNEGDKIKTDLGDLTVAGIVSQVPFNRTDGNEMLICSEALFEKLTGENKYTIVDIQLDRKATDENVNAIRDLSDGYIFSDRRLGNKEVKGAYYSFALFIYGFLIVIGMIAVFNVINSISMSVSARIKQYGAMRAIGMSIYQIRKMIIAEALTYAVFGCIVGCVFGLPINKMLFQTLITTRFGESWNIPIISILIIVLIILSSAVAAVYTPSKKIKNMSITDVINEL